MGLRSSEAGRQEPAVIDKEIPGFIGNRLQFAMLREAWALWASGAASAEAIDTVVRNSFGRRVGITGPIESADAGGLYTMYHFGKSLMPHLNTSPEPAASIAELLEILSNRIRLYEVMVEEFEAISLRRAWKNCFAG